VRILIIEDDPFIALDLQAIVEGDGHRVVRVCPSLAAARRHVVEEFDFALLDVDLGDGKSFEVAFRLCERHIPFAFVSGSRRSDLPFALRGAAFVPKPYAEDAILRTVAAGRLVGVAA
jgi:DNA-binding response OmpR family regulator